MLGLGLRDQLLKVSNGASVKNILISTGKNARVRVGVMLGLDLKLRLLSVKMDILYTQLAFHIVQHALCAELNLSDSQIAMNYLLFTKAPKLGAVSEPLGAV